MWDNLVKRGFNLLTSRNFVFYLMRMDFKICIFDLATLTLDSKLILPIILEVYIGFCFENDCFLNQCFLYHFSHPLSLDPIQSPSIDLQYLCSLVLQHAFEVVTLYMGKARKLLVFKVLKALILGSYVNSKLSLYTRQRENGEQVGFSFSLAFDHH